MVMRKASGFTIQYYRDMIVLSGAMDAIHLEAEKIVRRFAYSARPYQVKSDRIDRIVLAATS